METKKIKIRWMQHAWQTTLHLVNGFLVALGLRNKREYWGIIYDSVSKQPLDPVIVKLVYARGGGEVVETCVTDMNGRYGFLARPGKFKIFAQKTNYAFPSRIVASDKDAGFDHLYHGEFFELSGDTEVIAPNIPMDPVAADWNQGAKLDRISTSPYWGHFMRTLASILFWFSFFGLAVVCKLFPGIAVYSLLALYFLIIFLALVTPHARLWGSVRWRETGYPASGVLLELASPLLSNVILGKTITLESGKYFLRTNPGTYILTAKKVDAQGQVALLGTRKVVINSEGVLNADLAV